MKDHRSLSTTPEAPKKTSIHKHVKWAFGIMTVFGTALVVVLSCADDDEPHPRGANAIGDDDRSGIGADGGTADAGPCVDGAKIDCHVTVGTQGGVTTCLDGQKTCADGVWGPCVGKYSAHVRSDSPLAAAADPGELHTLGWSDAGPCQNNPCDPYCQDFEDDPPADAGYEVVPKVETVYYSGSLADALALTPPGFVQKGMKEPCNTTRDCQFDTHCMPTGTNGVNCAAGVAKCCMSWNSGEWDTTCNKPDPTTGFACTQTVGGQKVPVIPVCNRGSVTMTPPIRIYIFPGNSPQYPLCVPDKDPYICDTTVPIPPGKCIDVPNCPGLTGNGTKAIMINGPKNGGGGQAPNNPKWVDECTCENNWGVWSGNNTPCYERPNYSADPIVKTEVYHGVCPQGSRAQWQYLTWNTSTPLDSNVVWRARVADSPENLATLPFVPLGTAKATPAPDNHICLMSGPTGCPINVFDALGGLPKVRSEYLELEITINPSSDDSKGAAVNSWELSYSCPPSE